MESSVVQVSLRSDVVITVLGDWRSAFVMTVRGLFGVSCLHVKFFGETRAGGYLVRGAPVAEENRRFSRTIRGVIVHQA